MNSKDADIQKAVEVVSQGGIVIFPTDTAFGIGCRIDREGSVDRLFRIRKRPEMQAMPVLVSSCEMALAYFDHPSEIVRRFMDAYWPGALTIVAPCRQQMIYSPIRANGTTIGLRMPNHEVPLTIVRTINVPIIGSSANFHGESTPYRVQDVNSDLAKLVDYICPGVCSVGMASTVVDCSVDPYKIIRQGAVKLP